MVNEEQEGAGHKGFRVQGLEFRVRVPAWHVMQVFCML